MRPFDDLPERTKRDPRHIVLAEGEDPRVADGAIRAWREGLARITLLGRLSVIQGLVTPRGFENAPIIIVDPATSP
jgi:phosphate acetyltransferase